MAKIIVIASAKGGTGKTTVAVNLATALQKFGRNVILIDANTITPNVGLHLGATNTPVSLHDVLKNKRSIEEAVYQHSTGLKVIPASISIEHASDTASENLKRIIGQLRDSAEVIIIDSPTGLGKETKDAINAADDVMIVTTPDIPSVTDSLKTARIAESLGKKVIGIVINRVSGESEEMNSRSIEAMLEKPVIAAIPEDKTVRKSIGIKHPVVHSYPSSPASVELKKLASNLIGSKYETPEKKQ